MLELAWNLITTISVYSLVLVVLLWCGFQWKYWEVLQIARKLPVVITPDLPVVGHLWIIVRRMMNKSGVAEVMQKQWTTAIEKGYKTICFWIGPFPAMIFTDPRDIQKLLNSPSTMNKGYELNLMDEYAANGLITAPVEHWKVTRRNLNPVFHPRNLEKMITCFNRNGRELVDILSQHVGKHEVDVILPLIDTSLKTICQLLFGLEMHFDMKSEEYQNLQTFVKLFPSLLGERILKPWLRSNIVFKFLYRKELTFLDQSWRRFSEAPIKNAKKSYDIKKKNRLQRKMDAESENESKEFLTIVDVYCDLQENYEFIKDKHLVEELITLYLAGTDTISIALSSCLLAMAQYQDVQEKVYQEVSSVVTAEEDVTIEDLQKLPYTEKVIKECLRFFNVVPFTIRRSTTPLTLSGTTYPAGTSFIICQAGVHKNPQTFPDPESFNPDRWTREMVEEVHRYAYIPFSAGPRNCPGKQYAYMLMKVMLVHVLRRFRLSTTQDIHNVQRQFKISMKNVDGYNINLQNRSAT